MKDKRKIQVLMGDEFETVPGIESIKKGDMFRMFEPETGEPVVWEGRTIFFSASDPHPESVREVHPTSDKLCVDAEHATCGIDVAKMKEDREDVEEPREEPKLVICGVPVTVAPNFQSILGAVWEAGYRGSSVVVVPELDNELRKAMVKVVKDLKTLVDFMNRHTNTAGSGPSVPNFIPGCGR